MHPEADLSLAALALLVAEFVERLGLTEATLIRNDWGGAQILIASAKAPASRDW
jgi:pimeloyl-ACP methyl ester carboxylesterase